MNTIGRRSDIIRGYGSADRPLAKDLWVQDSREPVAAMLDVGNHEPSRQHVNFKRYSDPAYAQLEAEKLWTKTWLQVCREEDIPNIGDRVPVQLGPISIFVVRNGADEFKAFYNSCLHRGTQLCSKISSGETIRCPYHAWEWKIDGSLKYIPSHWDFKSMTARNGALREVHLGRWGGFIFVNAAEAPAPLEEALSVLPSHFSEFKPEARYTAARFRKIVGANWKIAQEAFHESYHVYATHPAATPYNGDSQAQYDIWDSENGHIGRQIAPSAVPSMHAAPEATRYEASMVYATIMKQWHYPDAELPTLDPKGPLRAQIADWHRAVQRKAYGRENNAPDAVMIDSTLYFMFPHFTLWLSESLPFVYQFTPHETNPELSYFDVRMLMPFPEGAPRPASSPAVEVGMEERISDRVPAFGFLGSVFDQDMDNMPLVQAGLKSADPKQYHSLLSSYQEMIIQHWNDLMDRYLAAE